MATMLNPYTGLIPNSAVKKGSTGENVTRTQTFLNWCMGSGLTVDGIFGDKTLTAVKKYQKRYGINQTGTFGAKSRAMASYLVNLQPWLKAMYTQYQWSKGQKYKWDDTPTIADSKKRGTCITFPAVSLQRLGILSSGKYFYFNPNTNKISGNAAAFVKRRKDLFMLKYPKKTVAQLIKEEAIKPFDIVGFDNPGYHTMVFAGISQKGKPLWYSMGSSKKWFKTYSYYADRKISMIVRLKKTSR